MSQQRKPSPLMETAQAMLDGVSDSLVRGNSRFRHSMELPMEKVHPDPAQPRTAFDEDELAGLSKTMAEHGQLQPILVRRDQDARGRWIIIAGERRWRAAQANGWETILAIEHVGDPEVAALVENLQRVDLHPVEEARGLQRLLQQKGWSQARAAEALGKTPPEVSSTLRILTLPEKLLEDLLATKDFAPSRYVLSELARVKDGPIRERLIRAAREGNLTQRKIRNAGNEGKPAGRRRDLPEIDDDADLSLKAVSTFRVELRRLRERARGLEEAERYTLEELMDDIHSMLS